MLRASTIASSQDYEDADELLSDVHLKEDHFAADASEIEVLELSKGLSISQYILLLLSYFCNNNYYRKWLCNRNVSENV